MFAVSCTKENSSFEEQNSVFVADIAGVDATKTSIDQTISANYGKVYWAKDDKIKINGKTYKAKAGGSTSATFKAEGGAATGTEYYAFYPEKIYRENKTDKLNLAGDNKYDANANYLPMFAYSKTNSLSFDNICGVFKVYVDNNTTSSIKIKEVIVKSSNKKLSGKFKITKEGVLTKDDGASSETKVSGIDITLASGKTSDGIHLPIPPATYAANDLSVTIKYDVVGGSRDKSVTYKETEETKVSKNNIYPFTLKVSKK